MATDAYVFFGLVEKHFPDIKQVMVESGVLPETFCQKWFGGLCVHVLPIEILFVFFEAFLQHGQQYLLQFGLALVQELKQEIKASNRDTSKLYAILRLEKYSDRASKIVDNAAHFQLGELDMETLRTQAYDVHLKKRIESARQVHAQKNEDSEDEDDDENDNDDSGECQECNSMMSEWYCNECEKELCEECLDKETHESHKVVPVSEKPEKKEDKLVREGVSKLKIAD